VPKALPIDMGRCSPEYKADVLINRMAPGRQPEDPNYLDLLEMATEVEVREAMRIC
jgi:hypothetical protein